MSQIWRIASLDMGEKKLSGKLDLGENLGSPQHDLNLLLKGARGNAFILGFDIFSLVH